MNTNKRKLTILCVSDTHGQLNLMDIFNLEGDFFIHAGDFTQYCKEGDFEEFCSLLDRLKFRHKIVICGNHEIDFDTNLTPKKHIELNEKLPKYNPQTVKQLLKQHCIYLQHETVTIEGIKIFGSPFTIRHSDTAFQYKPSEANELWGAIQQGTHIVVTHSPPKGILDVTKRLLIFPQSTGCPELKEKVRKIKPLLHVFGHIHDSTGQISIDGTLYINAAQKLKGKNAGLKNKPFLCQIYV